MNKNRWITLLAFLCLAAGLITGCRQTFQVQSTRQGDSEPVGDILDLNEAYDVILNNSTSEFIGYHVVDESFLGWLGNRYGTEALKTIASYVEGQDASVWHDVTGKSIHVLWLEYCRELGFQNTAAEQVYDMDCATGDEVVLDFSGDLTMADDVATTTYMLEQGQGLADCFSPDLIQEMNQADIMTVNHEFTYTTRGEAIPGKAYTFRGHPDRVTELFKIGIDMVGLANNHVYDYGEIGLLDTLDTMEQAGILYVGAGRTINDACRPVYFVANGRKIAIVAATQIERSYNYTRQATDTSAGVLKTLDPSLFCQVIRQAEKNADYVIAFVHWGTEGNANYGRDQEQLARAFVDAGADAIIGGHTHCLQGMEFVGDVPVFYSLGNYMFSSTGNMPADYDSGLAQIRIGKNGEIAARFLPCRFSDGVTSMVTDENERNEIFRYLEGLSRGVVIDDEGYLSPLP